MSQLNAFGVKSIINRSMHFPDNKKRCPSKKLAQKGEVVLSEKGEKIREEDYKEEEEENTPLK